MKALIKRLDKLSSELCRLQYKFSCHICQREGTDAHHIVSLTISVCGGISLILFIFAEIAI